MPGLGQLVRDHFLAGLLVVIPLAVITWMVGAVVGTLWRLLDLLPADLQPKHFFENPTTQEAVNALIILGAVLVLALGVSVLGWISRQFLGRKVLELIGAVIQRIPLLRSVYSTLDQLLRTMAPGGGQQFNRVVYIEYPRKGLWALAFVTSAARGPNVPPGHLNVYVPTTPNPKRSSIASVLNAQTWRRSRVRRGTRRWPRSVTASTSNGSGPMSNAPRKWNRAPSPRTSTIARSPTSATRPGNRSSAIGLPHLARRRGWKGSLLPMSHCSRC